MDELMVDAIRFGEGQGWYSLCALVDEGQQYDAARVLAGKAVSHGVTAAEFKVMLQEIGVIDAVRVSRRGE